MTEDATNVSTVDHAKALLGALGLMAGHYVYRTGIAGRISRETSILRSAERSFSMLSRLNSASTYAYGILNKGRDPIVDLTIQIKRDVVRPALSAGERYMRRTI